MTPDRLAEFQRLLRIEDSAFAARTWEVIKYVAAQVRSIERARKVVPDAQKAKKQLAVISSTSRKLAALLNNEPLADVLLSGDRLPVTIGPDGKIVDASDAQWEAYAAAPRILAKQLEIIGATARRFLEDDESFRGTHGLPRAKQSSAEAATLVLWPHLFRIWERAGRKLAYTVDGPLHRFLNFVHREFGLARPSSSTLRDAIRRYVGATANLDE